MQGDKILSLDFDTWASDISEVEIDAMLKDWDARDATGYSHYSQEHFELKE